MSQTPHDLDKQDKSEGKFDFIEQREREADWFLGIMVVAIFLLWVTWTIVVFS